MSAPETDGEAGADVRTLISYNRPLTRSARRALEEYGIVAERPVKEHGHWTEVDVEEAPPEEVLEQHELKFEDPTGGADPEAVYETPRDERVEIYADAVYVDGDESTIGPDEARDHAEQQGWEVVSDE